VEEGREGRQRGAGRHRRYIAEGREVESSLKEEQTHHAGTDGRHPTSTRGGYVCNRHITAGVWHLDGAISHIPARQLAKEALRVNDVEVRLANGRPLSCALRLRSVDLARLRGNGESRSSSF
jgi:hypothetical protein